jgi:NAD(P)-dependent dehydrogenase (short-subunit alcohol dehydrogenase family)
MVADGSVAGSCRIMSWTADLSGKCVLVTGASSGLGSHFAQVLAGAGAFVVLAARRMDALAQLSRQIESAGGRAIAVRLDVRERQSVQDAIGAAWLTAGPIDVVVNNSGVTVNAPVLEQTEDDWDAVIDTNLKGAFLVATEAARAMRDASRGGSIVNIASILGIRQAGQVAPYAVSKAGLVQLTKTLALELARCAIRVNALAPGYFETELNREFWETAAGAALVKRIPLRRLGRQNELDGVLLLLASDASSYITGSVFAVDGGHLVSSL